MRKYNAAIDWEWVRDVFLKKDGVSAAGIPGIKKSILACADVCLRIARSKAAPGVTLTKKKIVYISGSSIKLEDGVKLSTGEISLFLKDAAYLYIMAVTIGRGIEEAATKYMEKGDPLRGYILDRIGSFACESLAESVEEGLRKTYAPEGLSVSMRFSPGYCDFPIEEQFKLNKTLDFSKIGIAINKNCMMVPKKSITAIVGIGPKGVFGKKRSQCEICAKPDCGYRR
ncbi:MAG: vitamin B12 dependent-methionine synthase activation domain-containing protein [Candidatus Omnitrophota bacterium]